MGSGEDSGLVERDCIALVLVLLARGRGEKGIASIRRQGSVGGVLLVGEGGR